MKTITDTANVQWDIRAFSKYVPSVTKCTFSWSRECGLTWTQVRVPVAQLIKCQQIAFVLHIRSEIRFNKQHNSPILASRTFEPHRPVARIFFFFFLSFVFSLFLFLCGGGGVGGASRKKVGLSDDVGSLLWCFCQMFTHLIYSKCWWKTLY